MQIPFVGQAYEARSLSVSAQRCVNWYLETSPEGGRTPSALYPTPGLKLFANLDYPALAMRVVNGRLFVVAGGKLLEFNSAGVATIRGEVANTGTARLVDNGVQLLVLTWASAYSLDLTSNVLTLITAPFLPNANQCVVIDGYGVFIEPYTQRIRITSPYSFLEVDPLDFSSAEGLPDNALALASLSRELWIFGERSTEIWFNSGNADFPFERNSNTFLDYGVAAVHSIAKLDGALYWVGRGADGRANVYRASGYQPQIIAHHAISEAIEEAEQKGGLDSAYAFSYRERGHPFYVLTLPTIEKTYVYDPASEAWHERSYLDPTLGREVQHLARHCVTFQGKTIVGTTNNKLAEMSEDILSDFGSPIVRTRVCPAISADQRRLTMSFLEVLLESGVGQSTGGDPTLQMRQSMDGGKSFGDWHSASAGAFGDTFRRVIFRRLGQAVNRVIEIRASDAVKWVILGATVRTRDQ